jgi:hypothetical protein
MIACAFFTKAGAVILERHLPRLQKSGSCLVVSSEPPTDVEATNEIAKAAPGHVWMHFAGALPYEKKVGSALMHSKVFYAEAGTSCWLWVGSHNLTGRATEGANLEAAVLLTGYPQEAPFVAARQHIEACRAESSPCPIEAPRLPPGEPANVVLIHAEADNLPARRFPWHVLLEMSSAEYDPLLKPPADVRLYLYQRGALNNGWQSATPWASFQGTLTGLNFSETHPTNPGITASWNDGDFRIIDAPQALRFVDSSARTKGTRTQAVINIAGAGESEEAFVSERPKVESFEKKGPYQLEPIDADMTRFFTRESLEGDRLVYELFKHGDMRWIIPLDDLRAKDRVSIVATAEISHVGILPMGAYDSKGPRHPFIVRARFRLWRRPLFGT